MNKTITVIITKPIIHAGEQKQAGDSISVTESTRDWLIQQKLVETQEDAAPAKPKRPPPKPEKPD